MDNENTTAWGSIRTTFKNLGHDILWWSDAQTGVAPPFVGATPIRPCIWHVPNLDEKFRERAKLLDDLVSSSHSPKPQTCDTCNYWKPPHEYMSQQFCHIGVCRKMKFHARTIGGILETDGSFGCVEHEPKPVMVTEPTCAARGITHEPQT